MPGALKQWPSWPEFTKEDGENEEGFAQYKKDIAEQYGEHALRQSWLKVCKKLESLTDEIAEKGTSMIPTLSFEEVNDLTPEKRAQIQSVGCVVVRGVVERPTADKLFKEAKTYIADNKSTIIGKSIPSHYQLATGNLTFHRLAERKAPGVQSLLVSHATGRSHTPKSSRTAERA